MKSKYKVGDDVRVKKNASDYHVESMRGSYVKVDEVIKRSKSWTQYRVIWGKDNWEIVNEDDLIKVEYV